MRNVFILFTLLLSAVSVIAQEPRGKEFIATVEAEDVEAPTLYQEIVTPITIRPEETPLQPDEKRVIVHARPVWRVDDAGALAPISTEVSTGIETLKQVWKADGNTVRFRVTEDGLCVYKAGQHVLRARPMKMQAEATDGSALADADQAKPTATTAQTDRIMQRGSFSDVRFEHIVEPGSIKEIAWLDAQPAGIATARWFVLAYRWDSDTLTPAIVNGDVLWQVDGKTVLRWPAPVVTDAKGKVLRANYRIKVANPNVIAVLVNATDLRAATYPVGIDPTTTTATGDNLANRSVRSSSGTLQYKAGYLKLTMPTMSGNTVTDCTVDLWSLENDGPMNNIDLYARATSGTGAWDETSTYSTMDALSMGTAISTGNSTSSGTGTKTFNIFGDSAKGVSKFYTDNPTGGSMTICLKWSAWSGTLNTVQTLISIGDADLLTRYARFANRLDATHYPTVTITYTSGGGATAFPLFLISEE